VRPCVAVTSKRDPKEGSEHGVQSFVAFKVKQRFIGTGIARKQHYLTKNKRNSLKQKSKAVYIPIHKDSVPDVNPYFNLHEKSETKAASALRRTLVFFPTVAIIGQSKSNHRFR